MLKNNKRTVFVLLCICATSIMALIFFSDKYGYLVSFSKLNRSNIKIRLAFDLIYCLIVYGLALAGHLYCKGAKEFDERKPDERKPKVVLLLGLIFIAFAIMLIHKEGLNYTSLYRCFFFLIVVAGSEEVFFRWFFYRQLTKYYDQLPSVLISGLCWGMMHFMIPVIVMGENIFTWTLFNLAGYVVINQVFVSIYKYTGSLLSIILIHASMDIFFTG